MQRKTLLVLAASYYQVEVIQRAKELGYRVLTTDNVPENPGHSLADKAYGVDTTDLEGVLRIAEAEGVDGILSPASDVAVPTVAHVAQRLGLHGPSPRVANIVCDKRSFVAFLAAQGFPTPEVRLVDRETAIPSEFFAEGPGVVKPDRSSGAKGVFVVSSLSEYERRLPETLSFSPMGLGLLMHFIDGYQGTLIGLMRDGELEPGFFLDRETRVPPYATTLGLYIPARLTGHTRRRVLEQVTQLWALLGFRDGPFVCDFIVSRDDVFILEITPRLGGSSVSYLIREATGFDLVTYAVRAACGDPPEVDEASDPRPSALILLGPETESVLRYEDSEVERLRREPWVRRLRMDFPTGTRVPAFVNGRNRVGECLVVADRPEQLTAFAGKLRERLGLEVVAAPIG